MKVRSRMSAYTSLLLLLLPLLASFAVLARCAPSPAPRPQDAATNNIVMNDMTDEDGASLVAGLILAVAQDWDLGRQDATEFLGAVPAASLNGTTFGPTTHPLNVSGPISFSARDDPVKPVAST